MNLNITTCAGIALINDGKIFLVKSFINNDKWGIPKGHVECNENLEYTAFREFNEETGIKIISEFSYFMTVSSRYKNNIKNVNIYKCTSNGNEKFINSNIITEGEFKGNPENIDGKWFNYNDAINNIHKYQIPLIKKLKDEDKTFKTFYNNREAIFDVLKLKYNKTIYMFLNDARTLSNDHINKLKKYSNIVNEIYIFSMNDQNINIPLKNMTFIKFNNLYINNIIDFIKNNFNDVNIILDSNNPKISNKLYLIKQYFNNSNVSIL